MIHIKQKKAFTMIEMIMAIIVLGILASLAMPRLERDLKQEAADEILSQIRYTQHLALIDDMHEFDNPEWQKKFWRIDFGTCDDDSGLFYRIGSDSDKSGGGFTQAEAAIDPINKKALFATNIICNDPGTNPNVFLGTKYNVIDIDASRCNLVQHIGFDHLGRPHIGFSNSNTPDYSSYMHNAANQACRFTFTLSDGDTFSIDIAPETGYANIVNQPNS